MNSRFRKFLGVGACIGVAVALASFSASALLLGTPGDWSAKLFYLGCVWTLALFVGAFFAAFESI